MFGLWFMLSAQASAPIPADVQACMDRGIMWLADQFATQRLGLTAHEIYRSAYRERDGESSDGGWLATDALRDEWAEYTVTPKQWTSSAVRGSSTP